MQSHAWTQARMTLASAQQRLIGIGMPQRLHAIAPLLLIDGWLREPPAMFEPSDLAWDTAASLNELAARLAAQKTPLFFQRLPLDSPTLAALRRAFAWRGIVLVRPAMPTPFIDLGQCRDADKVIGGKWRSGLRRAERRASALGPVAYEVHSPSSPQEVSALIQDAYDVETRSWKFAAGTALTADPVQGDFFNRFAQAAAQDHSLRIAFLRIGSRIVAMQIAAEWQQRFWLFKISHDQAYGHCSPGQLLIRHTLGYAASRGLRSYEFMGIMDDWTRLWTRQFRQYVAVWAIPFSTTTLRIAARRIFRILRRRLRWLT